MGKNGSCSFAGLETRRPGGMMRIPRWLRWRTNDELDQEIQAHVEIEIQANLDRGLPPEEARYAALRQFGNRTQLKQRAREKDPLFSLETLARDAGYGIRNLRRNPGFAIAAVASLAL